MREFIYQHIRFEHLFCALILISRIGDIGSTWLTTPSLKLEANPVVRRFGWWFAIASVLVCLVPYYSTGFGLMVMVPSLLVSASNTAKIWFARAYGEDAYFTLLLQVARKSKRSHALGCVIASALFMALLGMVLLLLCPDPTRDWGYWFALGLLVYSVVMGLYGSLFMLRLFKKARKEEPASASLG